MNIDLLKDAVDYGVIGILFFMSILSMWFFIERLLYYKKLDFKNFSSKKILEIKLTQNLTTIGTIASNAPYIGLLGTVLAIMLTFITMGQEGIDAAKIMTALALALKATAAGLVVAIISMIFYNILVRRSETLLALFDEKI